MEGREREEVDTLHHREVQQSCRSYGAVALPQASWLSMAIAFLCLHFINQTALCGHKEVTRGKKPNTCT